MHTYARPATPFVIPFHEELTSKCKIDVHGEVCTPEMRFFVDILSGPHSLLNIEFNFGNERLISLRSCSSDIDSNEMVRLNGYTLALFPHRYPPHLAQCLAVSKNVNIYSVNVEGFQNTKESSTERDTTSGYSSTAGRLAYLTMSDNLATAYQADQDQDSLFDGQMWKSSRDDSVSECCDSLSIEKNTRTEVRDLNSG
ncbi:hypothetical protein GCK32_000891 [Trichostrongylus colubriformis]|uniref:Uncharacterized protein n=1 Tax=Trichostrongylus colubriformis TaxID=6319 RepID=A0AAN8IHT6_TRICO